MIMSDQESTTDNNSLVRTFICQSPVPNSITKNSTVINKLGGGI